MDTLRAFAEAFAELAPNPTRWPAVADRVAAWLAEGYDLDPELVALGLGYGTFLPAELRRAPELATGATRRELAAGPATTRDLALAPLTNEDFATELRRRRGRILARIGLAQLANWWPPEVAWATWSAAADAWVAAAVDRARAELVAAHGELTGRAGPARLAVLAYGKLGAEELNASSDIDLVLVAEHREGETSGGPKGALPADTFWTRLAQRLTALLADRTADGFVFRVDYRLRPEGNQGVLVPAAGAFLHYHRYLSATWERLALIRARPVAGDLAFGAELLAELADVVYPRHLDFETIEHMQALKAKIDREAARSQRRGIDLKLGRGGIRELEFLVQNLQLVFGGRTPSLRTRHTLEAIEALVAAEVMPRGVGAELMEAYRFLRRLEDLVQLRDDRQTYRLPADPELQAEVARAAGYRDTDPERARARLHERLGHHQAIVEREFGNLYARAASEPEVPDAVYELLESEELPRDRARELLTELGFRDPEHACDLLTRLRRGPRAEVYGRRTREHFERLLPQLVAAAREAPVPDLFLQRLDEFIRRIGGRPYLYALLRENPGVVRALARLFGASAFLSRIFIQHPEALDSLVLRSYATPYLAPERIHERFRTAVAEAGPPEALEERLEALRRARLYETLRVGWHDLQGALTLVEVQEQLTAIARSVLELVVELARLGAGQRLPALLPAGSLITLGLGKLGSGEFTYGSDLDLVFVTAPAAELSLEHAIRWAQKTITYLQARSRDGYLYQVDTRLRPSGNQGLLVTTFPAFQRYHEREARIWERVALVKATIVTGAPEARSRLTAELTRICYERGLTAAERDEMVRIRAKMATERGTHEPLKAAPGGSADVEIGLALAQIALGPRHPELRHPSPWRALAALERLGGVWRELVGVLAPALYFYRLLESRVRLLLDRPVSALPADPEQRAAVATMLGFTDAEALLARLAEHQEAVRDAWTRLLELLPITD